MCNPEKLAKQIEESSLDNPVRDQLVRRLKVASSAGRAAVMRDFEQAMNAYRAKVLPSCREKFQNKQAVVLNTA